MPVKIRLMRIGAKKRPFYRIVAVDERNKRTGKYIELIGTYNPLTEPKDIIINQELLKKWIRQGAVLSNGFLRITKQAPQKPPRKPKKEKPAVQASIPKQTTAEPDTLPVESQDIADQEKAPEEIKAVEAIAEIKSEGKLEDIKPIKKPE